MTEATIKVGKDSLASQHIWRDFGVQLQAFVRRRIADPHEADDVVGEILVRIHSGLHEVNDEDRVTAWLFRIARNAIIDSHRRKARSREQLEATLDDLGPQRVDAWDDTEPSSALRE
ncbi:MAG: RNA polymerase subunit sigma-24, partial [Chloroflexota bacterium]|nr:RNA polymerase subunit sigma-24 [Chloroflexota bacterium]